MKKSINIILSNNFIRLISSFINNATKEDIILFLPSKPISQIIIKLLNTKKYNSVNDSISLIKCLLDKAPENYIVSFVREGIIESLKNFKLEENLELNDRKSRIYGVSMLDNDYKKYRRERERYLRKRKDLLNKIKRKKRNKRDIIKDNKNNEQNKDNENNDKTNIDKEKEIINNDNKERNN